MPCQHAQGAAGKLLPEPPDGTRQSRAAQWRGRSSAPDSAGTWLRSECTGARRVKAGCLRQDVTSQQALALTYGRCGVHPVQLRVTELASCAAADRQGQGSGPHEQEALTATTAQEVVDRRTSFATSELSIT